MVIHGRPPWPTALAALSGFAAAGVRDPPPALRCGAWEVVENQMHIWSRKNKRKKKAEVHLVIIDGNSGGFAMTT